MVSEIVFPVTETFDEVTGFPEATNGRNAVRVCRTLDIVGCPCSYHNAQECLKEGI